MRTNFAALLCGSLIFTACGHGNSEDVKQSTIQQNYRLAYTASDNETSAEARFAYNNAVGTSLRLSGGSQVRFAGREMKAETDLLGQVVYRHALKDLQLREATFPFSYRNNDGEVTEFDATIPPAVKVHRPFANEKISRDQDLRVEIETAQLKPDESLSICLEASGSSTLELCETLKRADGYFEFDSSELERFESGADITLKVERTRSRKVDAKVQISEHYTASPLALTIE